MTDLPIPPEAFEAGRNALASRKSTDDALRACFTAMVKAWPGMLRPFAGTEFADVIILPIPQEDSDE